MVELVGGAQPLNIAGSPVEYGSPSPDGYGGTTYQGGTWVTNTVASPVAGPAGVRYATLGWTLTTNGVQAAAGSTTQAVFQLNADSELTWFWTNEYELVVSAGPSGTVSDVSGWYTNGTEVPATAAPAGGFTFLYWTGDLPLGYDTNGSITTLMDEPRTVQANFTDSIPQTRTWSGDGNWASPTNWTPAGMPGPEDGAVVQGGTVALTFPISLASLTAQGDADITFTNVGGIADLTVAGNLLLTNSADLSIYAGMTDTVTRVHGALIAVGGELSVASGSWIYPHSHPTNGGSAMFLARDVVVAKDGGFNASGRGFRGGEYITVLPAQLLPGMGPGGGAVARGGGYGGLGAGAAAPYGQTYGSSNAPVQPGSGGGAASDSRATYGGAGGGLVRIEARQSLTLDGQVLANGATGPGNPHYGSGSGGGIYLLCFTFTGSTNAVLSAVGGGVNGNQRVTTYVGGGGGRVAVWRVRDRSTGLASVSVDGGGENWQDYTTNIGDDGTAVWGTVILPQGTMVLIR